MKASTLHINPFWKTHIFGLLLGNVNCLRPEIHFESISLDAVSHISLHFDCKILVNHMYVMFVFQNPQNYITKLQGQNTQTCFLVLFLKARPMTKIFMSNWMILVYQTALKALPKNLTNFIFHEITVHINLWKDFRNFCRLLISADYVLRNAWKTFQNRLFHEGRAHPKTRFGGFLAASLKIDFPRIFHQCLEKYLKNLPKQSFSRR